MKLNYNKKLHLLSKSEKKFFYFFIFANFIVHILDLVGIGFILPLINSIIKGDENLLIQLNNFNYSLEYSAVLIVISLIFLFKAIFSTLIKFYFLEFTREVEKRLVKLLFKKYLFINWATFLKQKNSIYIRNIFNSVPEYISRVVIPVNMIMVEYIWLLLILIFVTIINYKITLFLVFLGLFILAFYFRYLKKINQELGKKRQKLYLKVFNSINQIFHNYKFMKIGKKENFFFEQFKGIHKNFIYTNYRQKFFENLPRIWLEFLFVVLIFATTYFAILFSDSLEKSVGVITIFVIILIKVAPSINKIIIFQQSINYSSEITKNLFREFIDIDSFKFSLKKNKNDHLNFKKKIEFKNVSFHYPKKKDIIKNLNLTIKKNTVTLVVGESGSGKTTFSNLILGLLYPSKGIITVDEKILEENDQYWFNKSSYVPQDVVLLNASIKENIAFAETNINSNYLNNAIKKSGLRNFISNLKNKESTEISDNSRNISGGEKKRIAIARAIYKKPQLLILDEPTNGLDNENIKKIVKTILKLKKNTTIVIITHTPYHFTKYDQIIDFNKKGVKKNG